MSSQRSSTPRAFGDRKMPPAALGPQGIGRGGTGQETDGREQVLQQGLTCSVGSGVGRNAGWSKEEARVVGESEMNTKGVIKEMAWRWAQRVSLIIIPTPLQPSAAKVSLGKGL